MFRFYKIFLLEYQKINLYEGSNTVKPLTPIEMEEKTGMKLITYVEIDFDAIPDSETGETDEHPITGHSLDIGSDNDPPDRMHTNTKSNEG